MASIDLQLSFGGSVSPSLCVPGTSKKAGGWEAAPTVPPSRGGASLDLQLPLRPPALYSPPPAAPRRPQYPRSSGPSGPSTPSAAGLALPDGAGSGLGSSEGKISAR